MAYPFKRKLSPLEERLARCIERTDMLTKFLFNAKTELRKLKGTLPPDLTRKE